MTIQAPGASLGLAAGGVVVAGKGFVARQGDRLVSGEALRWDQANDALWASGSVVLVMPGVRIHAERLGMRMQARTGDAWNVTAWVERGDRHMRIRADSVVLRPDRLTFHGVQADLGNGGNLELRCATVHVYLRDQLRLDKGQDQIDRYVEGVAAIAPTMYLAGVPVLWVPYLYRDYLLDYPWTTFEAGDDRRLGTYARFRIGSNLPEAAGWRTRLEARVDRHTRAGNAYGLVGYWRNRDLGHGSATWYQMPRERVADPADEAAQGGIRDARVSDVEHYVSGRAWAAAARWTTLPDADPSSTLPANRPPDERFRQDHLAADLDSKPFARRGAEAAWTTPWAGFMVDTARRANDRLAETSRILAAGAVLDRIAVAGPVGLAGNGAIERLERSAWDAQSAVRTPSSATRSTWDGRLAAAHWQGGVGVDAALGWRGVAWTGGRIGGQDIAGSPSLSLPYADAGIRVRLVTDLGGVHIVVVPRLGIEALGDAEGGGNPGFDFGDALDHPESDRRYLVTGLDGELSEGSRLFHAAVRLRWALRDEDRIATGDDGTRRASSGRLADVTFTTEGHPHPDVDLRSDGSWDHRLARWTTYDASAEWRILDGPFALHYEASYIPPTATTPASWLHRPGTSLMLSRYRLNGWIDIRPGGDGQPGGRDIDRWHAGLARRMVDGIMTLSYEESWDRSTDAADHRVALGFAFGGGDLESSPPLERAFGF